MSVIELSDLQAGLGDLEGGTLIRGWSPIWRWAS